MISAPFRPVPDPSMAVASESERSLSTSRRETAEPLPLRADDVLEVKPAADTAPSLASRFSLITLLVAPMLALAQALAWIFGEVIEAGTHATCSECERACAAVNPELPTARLCTGRVQIGECTVCPEVVELTPDRECPNGRRHRVVNLKPKPYLIVNRDP
jgi:hypothetical protein